ncbi:MAG TPA: flagellar protein FliT [Methylobacter sp.]
MEADPYAGIDELLRLTEEMFSLASEGAWDAVEACEIQRIATIRSLAPSRDDTDSGVVAKLRQMLDRNTEIVALAIAEKNKIAEELTLSRKLEKADQAYRGIDNGSN